MSNELYDLVFSGELVRGADPSQSKRNLGNLFKISEAKVDALFSGKAVTLKKNLDFATANKYRVAIKKAGCRVDLVEQKMSTPEPPKAKAVFNVEETAPKPLQEPAEIPPQAAVMAEPEPESPPLPQVEEIEAAPPPQEDSTSAASVLSIAPAVGNLVATDELEHAEPIEVNVSGISLKPEGGDLLNDDEKETIELLEINLDAELAPVGSDLLAESEREEIEVLEIDLSEFSVADAGEDLGQEKEDKKMLNPDISHLSLE